MEVAVEFNKFQFVHLRVKFPNLTNWIFFSGIYGSPNGAKRRELWSSLGSIAHSMRGPWLLLGDFNAMLSKDDKQGGSKRGSCSYCLFQNFYAQFCLKDMGFHGLRFTWS